VVATDRILAALGGLPPAALRLPPETADALTRLGLARLDQLYGLSRASLTTRFGALLVRRLDQALGRVQEALTPHRPPPRYGARLAWPVPIGRTEDIEMAIRQLAADLCHALEQGGAGAARLALALHLADGQTRRLAVGCSRPSRAPDHLARLFAEKLDGLDIGFGVEAMTLDATESVPLTAGDNDAALGLLVDRLGNRLGAAAVGRLLPQASHIPERAQRWASGFGGASDATWLAGDRPRPIRLLQPPEPIEAVAEVPDGPPVQFRWRKLAHRVRRIEGPERIAPEWWHGVDPHSAADAETRDYFRVEDEAGQRFWLYRDGLYAGGTAPVWYLHGLFA
jgi:protein ImuB